MKRLRRILETEVISEFLKAEFYHREYDPDRHEFETVVFEADLTDDAENSLRRALLFRRRAGMWRELPPDTQWWETELDEEDLQRIRVFPRAQWRGISQGNFGALAVADRIRQQLLFNKPGPLAEKVQRVLERMQSNDEKSAIILIGLDETHPLTLLEGNHRFVASLMLPRDRVLRRFRLITGFSPHMEDCCWYKTNLPTLSRYLRNRIKYFWHREADLKRLLEPARNGKKVFTKTIVTPDPVQEDEKSSGYLGAVAKPE